MPAPQELKNWDEDMQMEEPASLLRDLDGETRGRREARMTISEYMTDQDVKLSKAKYLKRESPSVTASQQGPEEP